MKNKNALDNNIVQLKQKEKKVTRMIIIISIAVGILLSIVITGLTDFLF